MYSGLRLLWMLCMRLAPCRLSAVFRFPRFVFHITCIPPKFNKMSCEDSFQAWCFDEIDDRLLECSHSFWCSHFVMPPKNPNAVALHNVITVVSYRFCFNWRQSPKYHCTGQRVSTQHLCAKFCFKGAAIIESSKYYIPETWSGHINTTQKCN